jgi:Flp pilus assembly protein TadB
MFGRKGQPADTPVEPSTVEGDSASGKGRPTPSRREAEAARKQQLKIPKDPKEAKKAARERERDDRSRSRAAMMAGDERYLPARDKGPARAFTRDFVDSRFTLAEFFIFFAIGVLVLGFVRNPVVQSWVSIAFFAFTALIVVDTLVLLIQLNMRAKKQFPNAADRKGLTLYASLRTLQLRRLRLPPPRVKRGGAPKPPKA